MLKRKYILPILLIVQIVLLKILALFPDVVENYYSNGFYVKLSHFERIIFGWIPFSVGDVIYFVVIFLAIRWFWKKRKTFRAEWKNHLLQVLSVVSVFYFFFNFCWGINYHREKLPEKLNISTEYSDADLLAFTKRLIAKTNDIHLQITKNDSLKVVFPYEQRDVFEKNFEGYGELAKIYPYFKYEKPSVKKSIISLPLTYMGFAGYLNPFTNEAQVNDKLPMYSFPMTACHEMAHQIGYASESEANFVGYLASIKNKDLYFQYSGYVTALRYCLGNWEIRDQNVMDELLKTVNPGILKNYADSRKFWDSYETFIETGFKIFYDNFLKLNQQDEGLDSYNRFVDLLVNYYKREKL
jgi:hypothetical protein